MKTKNNKKIVLIICLVVAILMISCESCTEDLERKVFELRANFHVQGFLDANKNGKWDEGESEISGFTFVGTMTAQDDHVKPPKATKTVTVPQGGAKFSFYAEEQSWLRFGVGFSYEVNNIPEGYTVGKVIEKKLSSQTTDTTGTRSMPHERLTLKYEILVPFYGEPLPTSTPTPTATNTPTVTPIPSATFTPTPSITAELLGYGSYGYAVDFVQFKIINKPASGTFSALVDGKDYSCLFMTPTSDTLVCQGEPFPSGRYVDVILYWDDIPIFSGQIFRGVPATPTKSGPD